MSKKNILGNKMSRNTMLIKLSEHPLGLDSTFRFRCRQCGRCCRNRQDILLSPYDLFRISHHLSMKPEEIVAQYCISYIGNDSRLPLILLKAIGQDKHCPFLQNNRCGIHASKPSVCALFPLGRFADLRNGVGQTQYALQSTSCGAKDKTQTVREWLNSFDLLESDEWFQTWQKAIMTLMPLLKQLEMNLPRETMNVLYSMVFSELYLLYQADADFLQQFHEKMQKITAGLNRIIQELPC